MIGWGKYIKKGSKKNYCPFLLIALKYFSPAYLFMCFKINSKKV